MQKNKQESVEEKKVDSIQEVFEESKINQQENSDEIPPRGCFEEHEVKIVF